MKPLSNIPRATYRLQLNRNFTFTQATAIVPYLAALGISHCYVSPCLKARPGSMHGYDIVDHNSLNPEIGSPEEFDRFVSMLHDHDMGLILDIVPNHMAVMGSDNEWWLDVLENGQASAYACFFDIDWHPLKEELHGKVLVPVLHDHYGAVLESGELKLVFREESGEFCVSYRDHRFPVGPREYPRVLQQCTYKLSVRLGEQNPDLLEFQSLITAFSHLPGRDDVRTDRLAERNRDKQIHKRRLAALCARAPEITSCIKEAVDVMNGTPADPTSFEALHELIKAQTFRLANWRVASDDINYRRFFDTNDLAALCMENKIVFEATHRLILRFMAEGKVDGLRIDHPDGLYDPAQYFERLKRSVYAATTTSETNDSDSRYVVIEKILTGSEHLPKEWPVSGTTGYDFANLVNGLFVDPAAAARFDETYREFTGNESIFDELAYRCRRLIIRVALISELNVLANQLSKIALSKRRTCDFTLNSLHDALMEVVANFPVYRTYVTASRVSEDDALYINRAVSSAKRRSPAADTSVFDFIKEVLLTRIAEGQDPAYKKAVTAFAMKFQQFTSPVMAKGLEDTAFYRYNRLISLNDVGADLHRFGITTERFHRANLQQLRDWPDTMLATSTHDSKRSEDVRARINVLSEMPESWARRVKEWRDLNRGHRSVINEKDAPSPNDEYLLYQTLVGAWPPELPDRGGDWETFRKRIEAYILKAMREAKQNTSWINQNTEYENAVSSFVAALLNPEGENRFLDAFLPFQRRVAQLGLWNSLSQLLLKLASPGVPDIYQGNDLLDFSLVDPDNRRPVDYALRQQAFADIRNSGSTGDQGAIQQMMATHEDGHLKMYVIWKTLCLRKQYPELFRRGEYLPVAVHGSKANHVLAFIRRFEDTEALVVVPRLVSGLLGEKDSPPIGSEIWKDTHLLLPACNCSKVYRNVLSGDSTQLQKAGENVRLDISTTFEPLPLALLFSTENSLHLA
ncbi:MAG: malto-oligosyltrehalose synthase [Candidatus Sulfotelmatobacter sp.]